MQAIVQAIGVPALASRRAADGNIVVIAANGEARRLFGMKMTAAEGRLADLLPEAVADEMERAVGQCLGGEADIATEHAVSLAGGPRWLRLRHRPFAGACVLSTVVAVGEGRESDPPDSLCGDACEHRQTTEVMGRLAAGGGHALNNYLQPILTFSRHMQGDMAADTQERYLTFIHDAALQIRDVMDIVHAVLGVGQAQAAGPGGIAVDGLVRDALRAARLILPPRVALNAEVAAPDGTVAAGRAALLQLLLALILDAADQLEGAGEVLLRVTRKGRDVSDAGQLQASEGWLELAVASLPGNGGEAGAQPLRAEGMPAHLRQAVVKTMVSRWGGLAVFSDAATTPETRIFLPEIRVRAAPAV